MNVLFVMNGIGSVDGLSGISGGDVRWIEIAKRWQSVGHEIHVLTPKAGVSLCQKLGLHTHFHVSEVPNEYSLWAYLQRVLKAGSLPEALNDFHGVVYSTTEHLYDVLPALRIRENGNDVVWVVAVHWVAPLNRKGTTMLNSLLFFFNQRLGLRYIKKKADIVLAVSKNTAEQIGHIGIENNVFPVVAGVDFQRIAKAASDTKTKKYDAIFMKRFQGTKGVFDIVDVWKDVVRVKRNAKLGMIGLGTKGVLTKLRKMVETYRIEENVDFLGPIYDFNAKFSILASSKLFVLPSYEENWAIVIGEAMAAGVPVLCYDLPEIKPIWENKIVWVPRGDKKAFASKVLELLDGEQARNELSKIGVEFIRKYDWHGIAEKEMTIIADSVRSHETMNK